MHPVLSIGIHVILQIVVWLMILNCLENNSIIRTSTGRLKIRVWAVMTIYSLFALLPVAGAMLPDSKVKYALQGWGNNFLGFFVYFGGVLIFGWLICRLIGLILHRKMTILKQIGLVLSLAAGLGLLIYGTHHARRTKVIEYEISIPKDTGDIHETKIVLISDLHLSVNTSYEHIARVVDLINEQEPDAVVVAGDIFTSSYDALEDPDRYSALLSTIKPKYGVFAVYGNHDVEETLFGGFPISPISKAFRSEKMEQFMKDCHFTVLYDETASIADGQIQIVGRIDGEKAGDGTTNRKGPAELLEGVDLSKPVIILEHEPVEFKALKEAGADLALCGHTHNGQLCPGNLIIPFFNENAFGYKNVSGLDTIVSAGVGFYGPPMRVGTNSDISVIRLHTGE